MQFVPHFIYQRIDVYTLFFTNIEDFLGENLQYLPRRFSF